MKTNRIKNQIALDECGKTLPGYEKTFEFDGEFINKTHENLSKVRLRTTHLIDIKGFFGFLHKQEALKLYELAHFCDGDILEIGTHQGLSAFIMAHAIFDTGKDTKVFTYDVEKGFLDKARENIKRKKFSKYVEFFLEDGLKAVKTLIDEGFKFGLAFIDHDHTYQPNYDLCVLLKDVIKKGGFVLFHDYNDLRNSTSEYGVWQAVNNGLLISDFTFYGIVGSTAIYRRK